MKKLFCLFSVVMFAVMSLNLNMLTASAEEPSTYYVNYDSIKEEWYYQEGSSWDETAPPPNKELYLLTLEFKDGDYLVVEAEGNDFPELKMDFNIGNLTVISDSSVIVYAKSIKDCYILHDSKASIHCNVTNAWVYDNSAVNFNKDCTNLELIYDENPEISVAVLGKCDYFYAHSNSKVMYKVWSFTDELIFDGYLRTSSDHYRVDGPAAGGSTPTPPAATTTPTTPGASDDSAYDDVPKTGQSGAYIWAFGIAAVSFAGVFLLKKRA